MIASFVRLLGALKWDIFWLSDEGCNSELRSRCVAFAVEDSADHAYLDENSLVMLKKDKKGVSGDRFVERVNGKGEYFINAVDARTCKMRIIVAICHAAANVKPDSGFYEHASSGEILMRPEYMILKKDYVIEIIKASLVLRMSYLLSHHLSLRTARGSRNMAVIMKREVGWGASMFFTLAIGAARDSATFHRRMSTAYSRSSRSYIQTQKSCVPLSYPS